MHNYSNTYHNSARLVQRRVGIELLRARTPRTGDVIRAAAVIGQKGANKRSRNVWRRAQHFGQRVARSHSLHDVCTLIGQWQLINCSRAKTSYISIQGITDILFHLQLQPNGVFNREVGHSRIKTLLLTYFFLVLFVHFVKTQSFSHLLFETEGGGVSVFAIILHKFRSFSSNCV